MKHNTLTVAAAAGLLVGALAGNASAQLAMGDPATNFTMTNWVTGLNNVTDLAFLSDGRAVVLRKQGEIAVVSPDGMMVKRMAAMLTVDAASEKGLLGIVIDAQDNIYLYASTGNDTANKHKVYKARAAADGTVTVDLMNPIVSMGLEGPANHDGGGLVIHEDHLYVAVGDTGANRTPPQNMYGACLNRPNGKILRVRLDGSVPDDNPLASMAMVTGCTARTGGTYAPAPPDKRIWAWGFRNPWRFWIDPATDLLWIGDVGETSQEEITVGGKGTNHGWPFVEGTRVYTAPLGGISDCTMMMPNTPCTAPQHSYPRGDGTSVTGGLVPPAGCGWGAYENRYFFADYNSGAIWTLDLASDRKSATANSRKSFASAGEDSVVSFKMGPDAAMYLASHSQGSVVRVAPKMVPATCKAAVTPPTGGAGGGTGGTGGGGGSMGAGTGGATGGAGVSTGGSGAATGGTGASTGGRGGTGAGTGGQAGSTPGGGGGGGGCSFGGPVSSGAGLLGLGALALIARRRLRRRD